MSTRGGGRDRKQDLGVSFFKGRVRGGGEGEVESDLTSFCPSLSIFYDSPPQYFPDDSWNDPRSCGQDHVFKSTSGNTCSLSVKVSSKTSIKRKRLKSDCSISWMNCAV